MPVFSDGIEMKYPSRSAGESYIMPADIWNRHGTGDKWDAGRVMLAGQQGEFVNIDTNVIGISQSQDVRLYISTSDGYKTSVIETDRAKMLTSRFMQSLKDWHNVEITIVFRYNGGNDSSSISIGTRGGLQESPCEGFAYKASLALTGLSGSLSKQQYYPSGNDLRTFTTTKMGTSIKNTFVMLKFCVYDVDVNGSATIVQTNAANVKLELYGSLLGTTAVKKLAETIDIGDWGNFDVCGGQAGDVGLWGGPLSFIQWGSGANIDLQSVSVREIDPSKNFDSTQTGNQSFPTSPSNIPQQDVDEDDSDLDEFGVQKIYRSKEDGNEFFPTNLTSANRFDDNGANITNNGDGTYQVNGKSRMLFYSTELAKSRGESYVYPTYDFDDLQKKGFWDTTTDWKNTETTYYVKCDSVSGSADELSLVARSVRHEETDHNGCGGSSYHGSLRFTDGAARLIKEPRHVDYTDYKTSDKKLGNILGKKIGFKFIVYNVTDTSVKLEVWLDKDANNIWELYIEYLDTGEWSEGSDQGMTPCGGLTKGAAITWGSVKQIMKDNGLNIKIEKFSIREIIGEKIGQIPPSGGGGGGTGSLARVFSKYIGLYNIIVDDSGFTCSGQAAPGTGPYIEVTGLTVTTYNSDKPISGNFPAEDDRTTVGWFCNSTSSLLFGIKPRKIEVPMRKVLSPTGNATVEIRDGDGNVIVTYGTKDVSTLTGTNTLISFVNDNAPLSLPNGIQLNWTIGVRYESGDATNYVTIGINTSNPVDSTRTCEWQWEKQPGPDYSFNPHTDRDMGGKIWV